MTMPIWVARAFGLAFLVHVAINVTPFLIALMATIVGVDSVNSRLVAVLIAWCPVLFYVMVVWHVAAGKRTASGQR